MYRHGAEEKRVAVEAGTCVGFNFYANGAPPSSFLASGKDVWVWLVGNWASLGGRFLEGNLRWRRRRNM